MLEVRRPTRRTPAAIHFNHARLEDMKETCSLDVAEQVAASIEGTATLGDVGKHLGISNERVRQVQAETQAEFSRIRHDDGLPYAAGPR